MLFWIWTATVALALALHLHRLFSRFNKHNVKHFTPLRFMGNIFRLYLGIDNFLEYICRTYDTFPEERFVGPFQITTPTVLLRDPELIKRTTTNDFQYFLGHDILIDKDNDPLAARTLISLKGDDWKEMRSLTSPIFTIYKIRLMVPLMVEAGEQMLNALKSRIRSSSDIYVDVDVKDLFERYTTDVFASCAFGIKMDSHIEKHNPFYLNSQKLSEFSFKNILIFLGLKTFPKLTNSLKVSYVKDDSKNFFKNLLISVIKDRKERNIVKPDMIHVLTNTNKAWSDDDLAAQFLGLLAGGSGTVSNIMVFLFYELTVNMDVQAKLLQEIRENNEASGGGIDYSSIQQMKYLDMVVSEVLRLWPVNPLLGRICNKEYNLGRPNEKATQEYIIKNGEGILIPLWSIHRDPKHFPDPDRFDPERFSEQNKHNIKPYTYFPFGQGPRNCIGYRYALCVIKVIIYQMLLSMELSPAAKTQVPAKLTVTNFTVTMDGGHWIRFKPRK